MGDKAGPVLTERQRDSHGRFVADGSPAEAKASAVDRSYEEELVT